MTKALISILVATMATSYLAPKATAEGAKFGKVTVSYSDAKGIGAEKGVMRRDPSDVIKVGDLYYVWYSKGPKSGGYDATVWYATSPDGHQWTEKGMAIAKGKPGSGSWDEASVFTPNILVAKGKYYLFFTAISANMKVKPDSKIGVAVSDSPDGPWQKSASNPILKNGDDPKDFDSHLIDDACLITRDGKYWLYYKGRQLGKKANQTQLGLAIAEKPEGPYVKHPSNPIIPGNHEVLVWPEGDGVAALIGKVGPKAWVRSLVYSDDGIDFKKTHNVENVPHAAGAYRPEAFTESGKGEQIKWGVHIGKKAKHLPFIQRFELETK
ncbi:xylosidase [Oceaniferula spumae]|uniref:Xylosidase n=1 Tax=Oceaniferula spumae TaxID=2979115 RepID=A0AAT9FIY4_9BACT